MIAFGSQKLEGTLHVQAQIVLADEICILYPAIFKLNIGDIRSAQMLSNLAESVLCRELHDGVDDGRWCISLVGLFCDQILDGVRELPLVAVFKRMIVVGRPVESFDF